MRKSILIVNILMLCIIFVSCEEKKGSLEGMVYYEYNNYIGNKPDIGAEIILYEINDKNHIKYSTVVGFDGVFKLNDIKIGHYLMITRSHNTNELSKYSIIKIIDYKKH